MTMLYKFQRGACGVMIIVIRNGHNSRSDLGSLALVRQPVQKENSKFKPVKLCLKIDLVSHPAHVEGVGLVNT